MYSLSATQTLCYNSSNLSSREELGLMATTSISAIMGDLLVMFVTLRKTYAAKRQAMEAKIESPLASMLLRDGTVHFLGMCALNVLYLISSLQGWAVGLDPLVAVLTAIIISRFLLNLRNISETVDGVEDSAPCSSTLRFASAIIGNMGAQLNGSFGLGASVEDLEAEEAEELQWSENAERIQEVPRTPVTEVAQERLRAYA